MVRPSSSATPRRRLAAFFLADAANAELFLHRLEHRADLLHRLADFLGLGLERARPIVQRLGLELDLRRIGRRVLRFLLGHPAVTGLCASGSAPYRFEEADARGP